MTNPNPSPRQNYVKSSKVYTQHMNRDTIAYQITNVELDRLKDIQSEVSFWSSNATLALSMVAAAAWDFGFNDKTSTAGSRFFWLWVVMFGAMFFVSVCKSIAYSKKRKTLIQVIYDTSSES